VDGLDRRDLDGPYLCGPAVFGSLGGYTSRRAALEEIEPKASGTAIGFPGRWAMTSTLPHGGQSPAIGSVYLVI
jgi:hypothetical protein